MQTDDPQKGFIPSPEWEELLHRVIGNAGLLTNDPHLQRLSLPDATRSLDHNLLSDEEQKDVLRQWKDDMKEKAPEKNVDAAKDKITPDPHKPALSGQNTPDAVEETNVKTPKSKKKVEAGKRIKKVAKAAAKKDQEKVSIAESRLGSGQTESTLSPFTQWVRDLKGSEYIHPYQDDFALYQEGEKEEAGISETYADLLAVQGYTDRAKAMYERLMTKFPEKSRYFAAKIEALA